MLEERLCSLMMDMSMESMDVCAVNSGTCPSLLFPERSLSFVVGKPAAKDSLIPLATHQLQQQLQQEDAGATVGIHQAFVQLIHTDAGAQFTCFPSAKVRILYLRS